VLHVIDGLGGGGSERWVYDIVRLSDASRASHRVQTIHPDLGRYVYADRLRQLGALGGRSRAGSASRTGRTLPGSGGPISRILRPAWHAGVVFPSGVYRLLRESIRFRPDVVHGHTFHGLVFALLVSRLTRKPLVATVPSLFSQMVDAGFGWMPGIYRRFYPHIDRFFTAYPDELRGLGVPAARIREIHGVIDTQVIDAAFAERARHRDKVRGQLGIPARSPVALSVGRLHPSKGHEYGLEAVSRAARVLPDLQWIVLGDGAEREVLRARAEEVGIGARTHLIGFVQDVLPYYASADIYLRTTLFEAENQSSYQAMGMAMPVVGFDTGAGTELIRRTGNGVLVPLRDSDRLGAAVVEVLTKEDRGATLGSLGRDYARKQLGIERTIEDLTRTYEDLTKP
jgi:glycosyltransferase involved in cell wall biosynthesis